MSFVSLNNHLNPSLMNNESNELPTESEENYVRKKSVEDLLTTTQEALENITLPNISNINVLESSTASVVSIASTASTSTSTSKVDIKSSSSSDSPKISSGSGSDKSSNANEDSVKNSVDKTLQKSSPKNQSQTVDTDKPKTVSKISERAKKKTWYSVIYPSYKSRTEDFKRLFKSVADDERLVVDYSCALQREILVHGRLYISQNYLCFYANIFGWETCLTIKLKDVTSVIKDKTARVIPNAISVWTQKEKYFFTSFTTRDKAYLLLFRVWQNALLDKPMQPQELWQFVHNIYGDELGLTSDDEDYIDPNLITEKSEIEEDEDYQVRLDLLEFNTKIIETEKYITPSDSISEEQSGNDQSINNNNTSSSNRASDNNLGSKRNIEKKSQTTKKTIMKVDEPSLKPADGKRKVTKNSRQRDESLNQNSEALPTDMSDSSDSDQNKVPFVSTTECTSNHEGRQLVHTILPINIDTLFNLLFSKSKFLLDFHVTRKTSDAIFNDWVTDTNNIQTRTVTLTATLTQPVGPKTTRVTENQVMRECSKPGELYSIDVNCVNAGIPYADSFYVLTHYCLVKTVDDNTMLSVHSQIKYKKYILGVIKGLIEKNAWTGLEDHFGALLRALQSETCIPAAKSKGRKTRRGTTAVPRPIAEDIPMPAAASTEIIKNILPCPIKIKKDPTKQYKWTSCFVIVLLFALIFLNVILLLKLWDLEKQIENDNELHQIPKLTMKNLPNNNNDWIKLLQQQEALHETEMKKWNVVLQTAIELLKKVSIVCRSITTNEKLTQKLEQINDEL